MSNHLAKLGERWSCWTTTSGALLLITFPLCHSRSNINNVHKPVSIGVEAPCLIQTAM
jgi:hypothetical protein